jgi:hypothetical protein
MIVMPSHKVSDTYDVRSRGGDDRGIQPIGEMIAGWTITESQFRRRKKRSIVSL